MVSLKLVVVVLVALTASTVGESPRWDLDTSPIGAFGGAAKGAANSGVQALSNILTPWNIFRKLVSMKMPILAEALDILKEDFHWEHIVVIGKSAGLLKAAVASGQISIKQAILAIYACVASASKQTNNPLTYVVVPLKSAVKHGDVDSTTAVKVLAKAVTHQIYSKTFADVSEPLTLAVEKALEDGTITSEQADKLKEYAKNAAAEESEEKMEFTYLWSTAMDHVNAAVKNGEINSNTALKIFARAIAAGDRKKSSDVNTLMTFATDRALKDRVITKEQAAKLKESLQTLRLRLPV